MARLFVAIELPDAARNALAAVCREVAGARWTRPDHLHLTLRFIGDCSDEAAGRIKAALATINAPSMQLVVRGVGAFPPPPRPPRILWAGVTPDPALFALQQQVERAINDCGFAPETRKWQPHITLARIPVKRHKRPARNASSGPNPAQWLQLHAAVNLPPFEVRHFHLFQSELGPKGPTHTILQSVPLS